LFEGGFAAGYHTLIKDLEIGKINRGNFLVVGDPGRIEEDQAFRAGEVNGTLTRFGDGGIGIQAICLIEVADRLSFWVEAGEPLLRQQPKEPLLIFDQVVKNVSGEARRLGKNLKAVVGRDVFIKAIGCAGPNVVFGIQEQFENDVIADTPLLAVAERLVLRSRRLRPPP